MKKAITVILALLIGFTSFSSFRIQGEDVDQFALMQYRWRENLVGNLEDKGSLNDNQYIKDYIDNLDENASLLYDSMNLQSDRTSLWTRSTGEQKSSHLTRNFSNLATLAKSYGTLGSIFYDSEEILSVILEGLDFLYSVEKYDGNGYYGNWWDWQIGIPPHLLAILFILGDEVPQEDLDKYIHTLELYLPDPYKQIYSRVGTETFVPIAYTPSATTGANRADLAHSVLGIGVIKGDAKIVNIAIDSVPEVFEINELGGEGFHEDGMFLFHTDTPYIGSYGVSLFKSVASMLSIVADTSYDMDQKTKNTFIRLVNDSTLPFINKGKFVGFVEGRSISRPSTHTEDARGSSIVKVLSLASQISTDSVSENMFKAVKYWVSEDPQYYIETTANYEELISIVNVITSDIDLEGYVPFDGAKVFPTGDRFVYSDENSYIGLSMYSSRISAYTVGNRENYLGWHLSDGFIYMMNDDKQFGKSYWPTVDWYRLPGTTVDTRKLDNATDDWVSHNSKSNWAGGVNSKNNASVSMFLDKNGYQNNRKDVGMDLQAKKSWFMIDGNLVSMGSGITGTSPDSIEQIVENKLLDSAFDYKLKNKDGLVTDGNYQLNAGDTLLLEANDAKNNIGYAFLDATDLDIKTQERTGDYNDINGGVAKGTQVYTENYLTMIQNYGKTANNGKYAYVQKQASNLDALDEIASRFKILEQTNNVHSVYDSKTNTYAATIWDTKGASIGPVTVDGSASLLIEKGALYTDVYISEPTHKGGKITLTTDDIASQEILIDGNIKQVGEKTFEFDSTNTKGKTAHIRFVTPVDKVELEEVFEEISNMNTDGLTPYSKNRIAQLEAQAETLIHDPLSRFEDVQAVIKAIQEALATLEVELNLVPAALLIQKIENLDEAVFTEKSWKALQEKLDVLKSMKDSYNQFESNDLTEEDLVKAYNATSKAANDLNYLKNTLDYSKLNKLVAKVEEMIQDENDKHMAYIKIQGRKLSKLAKRININQATLDDAVDELNELIKLWEVK